MTGLLVPTHGQNSYNTRTEMAKYYPDNKIKEGKAILSVHYLKEKRGKIDYCNICGQYSDLTWDHIPPKGITHGESVIANTVIDKLPAPTKHMKRFQSGIKYRSLCSKCNNVILGENDKVYQQFIEDVERQLSSPVLLNKIVVPVKINRLCRAMIGHALAAKNSFEADVVPDQQMRQYVLNSAMKLTENRLYIWLYPYKTIIIARDFVTRGFQLNTHPTDMISAVIASYPIAYMVTGEDNNCGVDNLGMYTTDNIEDEIDVVLHFETLFIKDSDEYKPFNWPFNISDDEKSGAMLTLGGASFTEDSRLGLRG